MVCFTMYDGSFAHSKKAQIIHSQISMLNMPMQPLGVSKSKNETKQKRSYTHKIKSFILIHHSTPHFSCAMALCQHWHC